MSADRRSHAIKNIPPVAGPKFVSLESKMVDQLNSRMKS